MSIVVSSETTRRGFLKRLGLGAGIAVLGGSAGLLVKPKVVDAYNSTWHALPQWQRNQAIVDATYLKWSGLSRQLIVDNFGGKT